MTVCVAIIGAGGKMGTRLSVNLARHDYELLYAERGAAGIERLRERGLSVTDPGEAAAAADVVVLAVPDARMEAVSAELVPQARAGATILMLDPAAGAAGVVTMRDDLNYVVCHPCHPALFAEQATNEARRDLFGGVAAVQDIVIALLQGSEEAFAQAEELCRRIFAPVGTAHRITVEQMALLEPAMAEVVAASAAVLIGEALEEAVRRGVPREAARAFMLGHVQVPLAIVLGVTDAPFSDAAKIAMAYGQEAIYRPDWRQVFEPERVRETIYRMLHPEEQP
jgi:pyrroline-5-carboxylate reductase